MKNMSLSRERFPRAALWVAVGAAVAALGLWVLVYGARELKESWKQENELHARETLATINRALADYHKKYEGYPDSLARLRGGEEGRPERAPAERARLLATELAQDVFERGGYHFRYSPGLRVQRWAATVPLHSGYQLTAEPLKAGASGDAFFYTDQTGEIRVRRDEKAGPDDPIVQP